MFRANEQEKKLIDGKLKESGLTMTDFIIRSITGKIVVSVPQVGELLIELKRQGNNLNQAVRNCYCDNVTGNELLECSAKLKELYKSLVAVIEGTSDAST